MDWTEIYDRLENNREDADAWAALETRVRTWARAQLRRLPWQVIEDVIADTCSSVAVGFDRARGVDSFAGFVFGFYLNERRRRLVEHQHAACPMEPSELELFDPHEDELNLGSDDRFAVWQALSELPARARKAVSLRHLEGLSAVEIAQEMGVSPANARQIVHVGLVMMRKRLREGELSFEY